MNFIINLATLMQEAFRTEALSWAYDDQMECRGSHEESTFDVDAEILHYWSLPVAIFKVQVFGNEGPAIENVWLDFQLWESRDYNKEGK